MARVTRCYLWQLGFRVITLGSLGFTPRAPKRTVEDKPGRNSDKTFHCTTSATYANGFCGLLQKVGCQLLIALIVIRNSAFLTGISGIR